MKDLQGLVAAETKEINGCLVHLLKLQIQVSAASPRDAALHLLRNSTDFRADLVVVALRGRKLGLGSLLEPHQGRIIEMVKTLQDEFQKLA